MGEEGSEAGWVEKCGHGRFFDRAKRITEFQIADFRFQREERDFNTEGTEKREQRKML